MKRVICLIAVVITLCAFSFAQAKPQAATPAPAAAPILANADSQIAILKAEHEVDTVKNDIAELSRQFTELQRQADILNPRYKDDQEKQKKAEAAVNAALEAAWKANGLSKDQYNFDPANMTFSLKAPPPTAAKNKAPVVDAKK